MARYTYYTQSKCSFLYSNMLMYCVIISYFIFAAVSVLVYERSSYVFVPFFFLLLYDIVFYRPTVKYWDMGGFEKMVIDTDAKVIIFDDRVKLKMENIDRIRLEMDERPIMFWFLAFGAQYKNLVNGELIFRLETKTNMVIYVQYRKDIKQMVSIFRRLGIPCRIQNEDLLDEGVPNYIWYLLILVVFVGGFILLMVQFFRNLFAGY